MNNSADILHDGEIEASKGVLTFRTVEDKLAEYFPNSDLDSLADQEEYSEAAIYEITNILQHVNKSWARFPRLYIVLRIIGHLELLDILIVEGITDFWFPFTPTLIPRVVSPSVQKDILQTQRLILTKAVDLEKGENGEHRNFADGEPLPFERKAILGKGGFSQVDKVLSKLSHKEYARKLIHRGGRDFERRKQRMELFERELKSLKRVKHRHIVELIGSYTDSAYIGLIMSPVADCDLAAFFTSVPESIDRKSLLRSYYGCLGTALVHLHTAKVRHKDIKPQNILVKGDNVLLTDFGISLDWQELGGSTTTGETLKSPRYCAPEVADYEPRNESSDIWSLGCVFLEMATILKGHTIDALKYYLEHNGSQSYNYRSNRVAVAQWMEMLRGNGSPFDNIAFEWIQAMLKLDRKLRPDAVLVADDIRATNFSSNIAFCGICCSVDGESTAVAGDDEEGPVVDSEKVTHIGSTFSGDTVLDDTRCILKEETKALTSRAASITSSKANLEHVSLLKDQNVVSPTVIHSEHTSPSTSSTLASAIEQGDMEQISALIDSGADKTVRDKDGSTPLHWASKRYPTIVSMLLRKEYLNIPDNEGRTAVSWAAESGQLSCMRLLLVGNMDPDHRDKMSRTALSWAAEMGRPQIVAHLLSLSGVSPNSRDSSGVTPLAWAAGTLTAGQIPTLKILLQDARINPNSTDAQGLTPLACATMKGHAEAMKILLDHKAIDPNIRDETGATALVFAALSYRPDLMELLLEKGAEPNVTVEFKEGKIPIRDSLLSWAAALDQPAIVTLLSSRKAVDPNRAIGKNPAPLHWAAIMGSTKVVEVLLRISTVDVDIVDDDGHTALSWAASKGHLGVVTVLLENRPELSTWSRDRKRKRTPLHWAAMKGHSAVVRKLLEAGVDASTVDAAGATPQLLAVQCRRRDVLAVFDDFDMSE